ncbi:MAG: methyl-accepting chemotaxis protein [Ruminiclostridium sp.]|nr:methyl-accepting chemotaxis protein [Ruminiclostridium sp.]
MEKKKRTLKSRLTLLSAIPVLSMGVLLVIIYIIVTYNKYITLYRDEGVALANAYASSVENTIESLSRQFDPVIKTPAVTDEGIQLETRKSILKQSAETSTFKDFSIAYPSGKTYSNTDISGRAYFKEAMSTKTEYVSSPVVRMTDNTITIMMGKYFVASNGGEYLVYGGLDADTFSNLIKEVHFEDNGIAYILDKDGIVVATSTNGIPQLTEFLGDNSFDASMKKAAEVMTAGSEGYTEFKYNNEDYIVGYATIDRHEGWTVVVATPSSPIIKSIMLVSIGVIVVALAATLLSIIITGIRIKRIAVPIGATSRRITEMAHGDLSSPAEIFRTNDEIETMSEATSVMVNNMSLCINDIGRVLTAVSHGDLTVRPEAEYKGDFEKIRTAMESILASLNEIMSDVSTSSSEVLSGSDQMAEGSQSLADGTTRQASAIEEISATIAEVSTQISNTAQNAAQAGDLSKQTQEKVNYQDEEIKNMVAAMNDISETSKEIEKIIKTIEDIAFQTNILALNAAVEAARAGDAGKGFAVVADEVRNLASKSAEAASSTTSLINASIEAVSKGSRIAQSTAESMQEVKDMSSQTANLISEIALASAEQNESIRQITSGVEQISQVIQTNSATAEETAASCEELTGQSRLLQEQVAKFKIRQ